MGIWDSHHVESWTWPNRQVHKFAKKKGNCGRAVILLSPTNHFLLCFRRSSAPRKKQRRRSYAMAARARRSWDPRACRLGGLADARARHIGRSTPGMIQAPTSLPAATRVCAALFAWTKKHGRKYCSLIYYERKILFVS
jgi:hypothetical protein